MRIATGHRAEWWWHRDLGSWETRQVGLRSGPAEVVRLGRGDPIVLVPGLAGGWRLLGPLARRLAGRYEVILFGLRGDRGPSAGLRPARIADYADELARLIEQLGLERPTICGVSFGGAVALELAVEQPHRVGSLILQGVEARFRPSLGATIAGRVLERYPLPSDSPFLNQFFNLLHGCRPEPGPLVDFLVERIWETDQAAMADRLRALGSFDVSDRLWRVDCPTLVLAGTRDVIVPPARQRALADAIPGAQFEALDDAGHIGFLTHRAEVARRVHRLLRGAHRSLC